MTGVAGGSTVSAKASVPRATNALARARLFRILDRALARGAAWIAAPAGAGKTMAVVSYLAARRRLAVFYDVDATDTDCANVFHYLTGALRAATRTKRRLPGFQVHHHGNVRAFAHKFFEGFFAALPAGAVLVLDNCHAVAGIDAWHQILEEATRAVPVGRGLVIVSRGEPPSPLARLIVNERLALVTGHELRFTAAEARALARVRLPAARRRRESSVRELCELADGWAAGLALVLAHAARGDPAPDLARRDERLFDYFSAEVLGELPPDAQRVLRATALLPSMTEAMAVAVSGFAGAGTLLADLHRRGLLVERLATAPVRYRYHPLLRAFLLAGETPPDDLVLRAATACADGGLVDDAVDLFGRAGAHDRVATVILQNAQRLVAHGRHQTLAAWLARLDDRTIAAEPWLRFWQATANMLIDQAASRVQFDQAFEAFRARGDAAGLYLCIGGATQVILIESEDFRRLDPWFDRFSMLCLQGPRPPSDDVEAAALTPALMACCSARPGHPEIGPWVARAHALAPASVASRVGLWSSLVMVMCHATSGRLEATADLMARARRDFGRATDPMTRMMVDLAEVHRSMFGGWRDLLEAGQRALATTRAEGLMLVEATNLATCAQAYALGGDEEAAADHLRQAAEAAARAPTAYLVRVGLYEYTEAMVAFAAGRFDAALRCLDRGLLGAVRTGGGWAEILIRTLRSVVLAAQARDADAEREAAALVSGAAPGGLTAATLELLRVETRLRVGDGTIREAASRGLERGRAFGSYALMYLRGLPHLVAHGLGDPHHRGWLRELIVDSRFKPWPQHLDLAAWPFAARVRTLGGLSVETQGARPSRKEQKAPLRLLKLLVTTGGRGLPVSRVCEALWSDDAPTAARRKLDTTLHRLRALLGADAVPLAGGALTIDRARCFVDAWAFASLADRATSELRREPAARPSARALALFAEAEQLYGGAFLAGEDDPPEALRYREKLRGRFVHLVLDFAGALEAHASDRAIAVHESALAIDDQATPLWQGLMRGHLAAGRPADALKVFERSQLALAAEGGAGPTAELRALHAQARNQLS
jgi:ATP/maltotriose-dependent transcriptional regulator MalT/DNA-binding SARP family transcriptional activator